MATCGLTIASTANSGPGDYDLFAVWPSHAHYHGQQALGVDRRPVHPPTLHELWRDAQGDAALRAAITAEVDQLEPAGLGNITLRIEDTAARLNMAIARRGYRGGNIVHHSDEAGRPFIYDSDLPAIAFVPSAAPSPYPSPVT